MGSEATSRSAFITGCATGIGRAVAESLAQAGYNLTVVDIDQAGMLSTATHVRSSSRARVATHVVDVRDAAARREALAAHIKEYGSLDLVVLNAGIGERGDLFDPSNQAWQATLDIDLTAVIVGIRESVLAMKELKRPGAIISIASAGGIFPMPVAPVYAASKAGVVHATRSSGPGLAKKLGIRLMAACPEFVDTPLVRKVMAEDPAQAKRLLGSLDIRLLPPKAVADLVLELATNTEHKGGTVALLRQDGSLAFPFKHAPQGKGGPAPERGPKLQPPQRQALAAWAGGSLPRTYKKIQVHRLSISFPEATRLIQVPLASGPPPPGQLLIRRAYVGINASDVNYTAGRYFNSPQEAKAKLPFDAGFESVGVVAAVGAGVTGWSPGDPVATMSYDGFAEFALAPAATALPVTRPTPEAVALLTSGLTASIALQEVAHIKRGETVLVTAAAGGTGQFAVQLAKLAGCHVVATAGGPSKVQLLKKLGADRVIDYKSEQLKEVLKREYPKGVDVVYESVGGDMFAAALGALSYRGRLLVIGMMSQYGEGWPASTVTGIPEKLLWKSAALHGFFLLRHASHFKPHLARLSALVDQGKLQVATDPTPFKGIESVPAAVAHLQSGQSIGKVVVQLAKELPPVVGPASKL